MTSILPVLKFLKPRSPATESWELSTAWKADAHSTKEPEENDTSTSTSTQEIVHRERSDSFEIVSNVDGPDLGASNDNCQFQALAKSFCALPSKSYEKSKRSWNANANAKTVIAKEMADVIPEGCSAIPIPVSDNNDDYHHDDRHNLETEWKASSGKAKAAAAHSDDGNHSATEPFPDYFESCEGDDLQAENPVHEAAYNYALSKVAEAAKVPPNSPYTTMDVDNDKDNDESSNNNNNNDVEDDSLNTQFSWEVEPEFDGVMGVRRRDAASRSTREATENEKIRRFCLIYENGDEDDYFDTEQEERLSESNQSLSTSTFIDGVYKGRALNEIEKMLTNPTILPSVRQQFSFMTNMVLRMNHAMFHSHKLVLERDHFLSGPEKVEIRDMACKIINYASVLDGRLQGHVHIARRVYRLLLEASKDEMASPSVLYKRMARIAAKNLRKPRTLEKRLLCIFLKLYENYIYNAFLEISAHHKAQEDKNSANQSQQIEKDTQQHQHQHHHQQQQQSVLPSSSSSSSSSSPSHHHSLPAAKEDPEKMKLHDSLVELWKILTRATQNYDSYVTSLNDLARLYLRPVMAKMKDIPRFTKEELLLDDEPDLENNNNDDNNGKSREEEEEEEEVEVKDGRVSTVS